MTIKIHKEGHRILGGLLLTLLLLNMLVFQLTGELSRVFLLLSVLFFLLVLQFFRHPRRHIHETDDRLVYAPADGKVVVLEETQESEYFGDKRLQISIFMSPTNVHVNRSPVGGRVSYYKYHPGRYLVAWHPKSSTENERATIVIDNGECEILLRQIAGAMARRIKNYLQVGEEVNQGEEVGFIKFGSRVDLFLPPGAEITVEMGQKVYGGRTLIARLP